MFCGLSITWTALRNCLRPRFLIRYSSLLLAELSPLHCTVIIKYTTLQAKMVRKPKAKRLEVYTRVKKHKIRSFETTLSLMKQLEMLFPPEYLTRFHNFAGKLFLRYAKFLSRFYLIPYNVCKDGKLELFSARQVRFHRLVLAVQAISMVHKTVVSVYTIVHSESETMDFGSVLCITSFLFHLVPLTVCSSVLFKREETVDIVNNWETVLNLVSNHDDGNDGAEAPDSVDKSSVWNTAGSLVVTWLATFAPIWGIIASLLGFVIEDLPVSYMSTARSLGLDPVTAIGGPTVLWKLTFWPLEFLTYASLTCVVSWSGTLNMMVVIVTKTYLDELRSRQPHYSLLSH